jgi:hypothetical protein
MPRHSSSLSATRQAESERIWHLYQIHRSGKKVARLVGKAPASVYRSLRKRIQSGALPPLPLHNKRPVETEELWLLYQSCRSCEAVAAIVGMSAPGVRCRLTRAGYKLLTGGQRRKPVDLAKLHETYLAHDSGVRSDIFKAECERQDISSTRAYLRLKEAGLVRTRREANILTNRKTMAKLAAAAQIPELERQIDEMEAAGLKRSKPKGTPGRKATNRRELFLKARDLTRSGTSFPQCAELLRPEEVAKDGRSVVAERIRAGVRALNAKERKERTRTRR